MNPRASDLMRFCLLILLASVATDAQAGQCGDSWSRGAQMPDGSFNFEMTERTLTIELKPVTRYENALETDSITIPNGRPIYALFVHGYSQNEDFNLVLCYNFAKRLMQDGAYVHHAWWNNLCAEYMARPLHSQLSYPGHAGLWGMWDGTFEPEHKAFPADDYQFQADAALMLQTIRDNNPNAIIIVVGHSMGGGAVARLGTDTKVVIDILAPLDPVGNRSSPWIGWNPLGYNPWHNWTRYRIARPDFETLPAPDPKVRRRISGKVVNLWHRYQKESAFPMDYLWDEPFLHTAPDGGSTSQAAIVTCKSALHCFGECCNGDGHGEIVGYRGLTLNFESNPWGLAMGGGWPAGPSVEAACERERLLTELPDADYLDDWKYRPSNPDLCMVSEGLIALYEGLNLPPTADAGGDQVVALSADGVRLDGSGSSDPEGGLEYLWEGDGWHEEAAVVTVHLEEGTHEISLTVTDPSGHIDRDEVQVTVVDLQSQPQGATRLAAASPNPFNSTVGFSFELGEAQHVSLDIYDLQGRLVRSLEDGVLEAGLYEKDWNGKDDTGRLVSSGCYLVRMKTGQRVELSKVAFVK